MALHKDFPTSPHAKIFPINPTDQKGLHEISGQIYLMEFCHPAAYTTKEFGNSKKAICKTFFERVNLVRDKVSNG